MKLPILKILLGYIIIALITLGPLLITLLGGAAASLFGCTISEVGPQECLVLSVDIGWLFYAMGVIGWLFIITVPLGVLLFVLWTVMTVFMMTRKSS